MYALELLKLLADGAVHPEPELARLWTSGQTGAQVSMEEQLSALEQLGLEIQVTAGQGVRLVGGIELLDRQLILDGLNDRASKLLTHLQLDPVIDSTNAQAIRLVEAGHGSGLVCTAEQQSAGRGRRGRTWISPFASNIYLSLVWEIAGGVAALEGLSLAAGVATVHALQRSLAELQPGLKHSSAPVDIRLKWPNDVLYQGDKLGGILVEMTGEVAGPCQVVVGVGLNVQMPASAAADIDQSWSDMCAITGARPSRTRLLSQLLNELLPMLAGFEREGFTPWQPAWESFDAYAGAPVVVHAGDQQLTGIARGVDSSGALKLETATGLQLIHGGEVSLRSRT